MTEVKGYRARRCRASATCLESNRRSVGAGRAHLGPADVPSSAAPLPPAQLEAQSGGTGFKAVDDPAGLDPSVATQLADGGGSSPITCGATSPRRGSLPATWSSPIASGQGTPRSSKD